VKSFSAQLLWGGCGALALTAGWFAAAWWSPLLVPTPDATAFRMVELFQTTYFHEHFWITMLRMLGGATLGLLLGIVLGIPAGLSGAFRAFVEPLRWAASGVPPIVLVLLMMLWLGMGTPMVLTLAGVLLSPVVYVNTLRGMERVDPQLREMARVFRFTPRQWLTQIYLPALASPLAASATLVLSTSARVVVMAEVLGANEGIGYAVSLARTHLEVAELFAWIVVNLLLIGALENLLLRPLQQRVERW
jgi:NitT/TauT family transport system permease protein